MIMMIMKILLRARPMAEASTASYIIANERDVTHVAMHLLHK